MVARGGDKMSTWKRVGALVAWLPPAGVLAQPCTPQWRALALDAPSHYVYALHAWDPDGPGPAPERLAVGGNFATLGGVPYGYIALWDGTQWSPLAGGVNGGVRTFATFDPDGPGPAAADLIVGGTFNLAGGAPASAIARWDGAQWHPLGAGISPFSGSISAMLVHEGKLLVTGVFSSAGGIPVLGIALWDGNAWSAFPASNAGGANHLVHFENLLVAGGLFTVPGTLNPTGVLRWNGASWGVIGAAYPECTTYTMQVFGGELVAMGSFSPTFCITNQPYRHVAAWNGQAWRQLGEGIAGLVLDSAVLDVDGPGPRGEELFAGGNFTWAGTGPAFGVAAWDGQAWSSLGTGTNSIVRALGVYRGELYVGGQFTEAGGVASPYIAQWGCATCYADCNLDRVLSIADLGCFQTMFSIGDPYADCNGDGVRNLADFGCFMTKFAVGCP